MKTKTAHISKNAKEMYNAYRYGNFNYSREKYATFLIKFLKKIPQGAKVFDIGCGTGYWFDLYLRMGVAKKKLAGIDLAPKNIALLKKRGFNAKQGDILDLPLKRGVSDFTICDGVIHHCADPFKGFQELVKITKKGGYIYINVYNIWHPYFYIVHKATFPIRFLYWHWNKKAVENAVYPFVKLLLQPVSIIMLRKLLDDKTTRSLFFDQIMTPRAHLFSKRKLQIYANKTNCTIKEFSYNRYCLMLAAIIKK